MAASSKPTAIHFLFVFFLMMTVLLGLFWYLTYKDLSVTRQAESTAKDRQSQSESALRTATDEISALKRRLGYDDLAKVGTEGDAQPDTVLGKLMADLTLYGRDQVQPSVQNPTVAATLLSLRSALNSAQDNAQQSQRDVQSLEGKLAQELATHMKFTTEVQNSQQSSETQLQQHLVQQNELLSAKDREIAKSLNSYRAEQREKESVQDELANVRKAKDARIADLEKVVDSMRQRLNELEDMSFDKPDGQIVRVDNTTRTVWIDLGTADNLHSQVGFSVYTKDHQGVGRGNADIKAKIDVTKPRAAHLAEARILKEDERRPIQVGDPIYSPIWSKGMKEYFSFVGIVDMDGDGKSDRDLLHTVLNNAGAGIEVEIDDLGNRIPPGATMSVRTKFLVVGDIEDPATAPTFDAERQAQIKKLHEEYTELNTESLRKGIKSVSFRDFLNYIGFEPQQRLFVAGEDRPFSLKHGALSASTDEVQGAQRLPSDYASSRFRPDRPRGASESNGNISGLYRK